MSKGDDATGTVRWSVPRALMVGLLAVLAPTLVDCGREDEFDCEEAVVKIRECCPGVDDSNISCRYIAAGACTGPTYPTLSVEDSECIVSRTCNELRANGLCARVPTLSRGGSGGGFGARVCL